MLVIEHAVLTKDYIDDESGRKISGSFTAVNVEEIGEPVYFRKKNSTQPQPYSSIFFS